MIRQTLTDLEKSTNTEEARFTELRHTIGTTQSDGIYPSVVGLERSVFYVLFKVVMPVLFAAILVFVDVVWVAFWVEVLLILGYFGV
jgi:hypothetical protein